MSRWIESAVLAWLRVVAPRGWTDTVVGDLREELDERGGWQRARALTQAARIAARFSAEAFVSRLRRTSPRKGPRNMDILTDLRQAARALARTPAFSILAIVTLAIAIGANTAIYSALSSLVLNPLPFKDGDRFVYLWQANPEMGGVSMSPRKAVADRWREATHIFEAVERYDGRPMTLVDGGEPEDIDVTILRPSTLAVFGVQPILGRTFIDSDTTPDAAPVALVSHALWRSRFGGNRQVVGKTITLSGVAHTIVGVMPARFAVPLGSDAIWVAERRGVDDADPFGRSTVAKLAPGVTQEQAQAALDAMPPGIDEDGETAWPGRVMKPAEYHGTAIRTALLVLSGAVGVLLLIACVNVANLMLSRHSGRRRELAVRHALGASRSRIVRYLLVESALLAAGGGLAGLAVAYAGLSTMSALRPQNLDVLERLALDPNALMFAAAATVATGLLFGLGPALSGSRVNLNDVMKSGGRSATSSGHGVRALLTITQVGLALILLVGAGLLIRSYAKVMALDPGYNADGVLAVDVSLPAARYPDAGKETRRQFFDQAMASIASLPGVTAVTVGTMPARPMMMLTELSIDGRPDITNRRQIMGGGYTTPSYFAALGIPLRQGRTFTADDTDGRGSVVVVNDAFAKEFWPGESAIGKRLKLSRDARAWTTIVGVSADVKFGGLVGTPFGRLQVYFPRAQSSHASGTFIIRAGGDPAALIPAIKTTIWALDDQLPLTRIATARQLLARSASERRFNLALLGIFAACGLLLAVVGVYGVTALFVGQRQREVGIRMALGATRGAVAALVLRQTAIMLGLAVASGGAGAWLLSRYLESLVFATTTTDALTFASAITAIVIASIAATLVPLRRATSVDPAIVLRAE